MAAGYLLVRTVPRPPWASAELLPARILSACTCLCPQFPGLEAIDWVRASEEARGQHFDEVGLAPERRAEARRWATAEFDRSLGWPGIFLRAEDALAARRRFFPQAGPVAIGLALPEARLDAFIAEATPPPPGPGYAPQGESGFLAVAKRREPLAAGHRPLGFELLEVTVGGQIGCSWLCNGLETHFAAALGVRPDANGLLATLQEAERCCAVLDTGELGAEPGPWLPWRLVEYP